jgi:hypothetical protein
MARTADKHERLGGRLSERTVPDIARQINPEAENVPERQEPPVGAVERAPPQLEVAPGFRPTNRHALCLAQSVRQDYYRRQDLAI